MLIQTEAQIYLESQRGYMQSEGFRSYHTFNSGSYQEVGKEPFGALQIFDDQTLSPEISYDIEVEEPAEIILIPLAGGIEFKHELQEPNYINSGEAYYFFAKPTGKYQVANPYPSASVNYLQIRFKSDTLRIDDAFLIQTLHNIFDISEKNILHPVFNSFNRKSSAVIGKYEGRQEGTYKVQNTVNGIFVFVIEGAFEVQNRLLEKRDGLSLLHVEEVAFEALSNDAIILVVEVGMV